MPPTRRVYVSMPADDWLDERQNGLKWALVDRVRAMGFQPEIFLDPKGRPGFASGRGWTFPEVDAVARRCIGALFIGLPRWIVPTRDGPVPFGTELSQYEAGVLFTLGLPILVLMQKDLARRGVFDPGLGSFMATFPPDADRAWLASAPFKAALKTWKRRLDDRRDVFLGYSGKSVATARKIKRLLEKAGATVLDWKEFARASTIFEQIEEAARRCSGGVFLFTRDDRLVKGKAAAAPRDNVVFEAGYFAHAKGNDRVMIVQQEGAKMPSDLGGKIYEKLESRIDVSTLEEPLRRFVETNL
jgi:predicted nucleotide-binding protein with TIR-like domain